MRGEVDEALQQSLETAQGRRAAAGGVAGPLPGGKALLRLLQVLERDGLDEIAAEAVAAAVPDAQEQRRLGRFLEGNTASPSGKAAIASAARTDERSLEGEDGGAAKTLARAYMEAVEQLGPPTASGPQWRSLGPWTIPNGQTYGSSRVNVSGRVGTIAVDPSNPAHVLAGAANGGVWESFDRGASWAPRTDYAPTLTVGAIAFDPTRTPRRSTAAPARATGGVARRAASCARPTAAPPGRRW